MTSTAWLALAALPGAALAQTHCGTHYFENYSADIGASVAGHMFMLDANNQVRELVAANRNPLALAVLGWVQDARGEVYLLAIGTGTLTGTTGMVLRIDP